MKAPKLNVKFVNLLLIFILAYTIVHLLHLFVVYFAAYFIGVPEVQYYFSYVTYNTKQFTAWSRLKVVILYGIPALSMGVFAIIFWLLKEKFSFANTARLKLFFLWLMIISISFLLADFIGAPYYRRGVAIVASWFYFSKEFVFAGSFLFWAMIPVTAYYNRLSFMKLASSRRYIRTKWTRINFLANNVVLPAALGSSLISILLILAPGYNLEFYMSIDFIRFFVLFGILFFVLIFNFNKKYVGIKRNRELSFFSLSFVVFVVVSIAVIYLSLYFT